MQIRSNRKGFKAFECKFEPFERDLKHSNANSSHSKGFQSIRMQILSIRKGFEAFKTDSKHSKQIRSIRKRFEAFKTDLKHSNANSNHLKGI